MSRPNFFKGKGWKDIASLSSVELMNLPKSQLRQAVSRLSDVANKRVRVIEKSGIYSPAVMEYGTKFSTRGKDYNDLLAEYARVKGYLSDPTSSLKGTQEIRAKMKEAARDIYGVNMDDATFNKMVEDYYKMMSYDSEYQSQKLRYGFLYKEYMINPENEEEKEPIAELSKRLVRLMERYTQPGGMGYEGTAQFFRLE